MKRYSRRRLIYIALFILSFVYQTYVNVLLYERSREAEDALNLLVSDVLPRLAAQVDMMETSVLSQGERLGAHLESGAAK